MVKVKTALASFLLVSNLALAEDVSSFQAEAVKELHNKGILKNVVEEEKFDEKETFSRYEVATMLYNTINIRNGESLEGASETDILILKALVSDLALELGRLGAKDAELMREIEKVEARLDKKFSDEILRLENKMDRIRLTSDFELAKKAYLDDSEGQDKGFEDFDLSGYASALLTFTDFAEGRVRYNFDKEEVDELELNLKTDLFSIQAFKSEEMKLPTFRSTLGLIDGQDINSKDGAILQTKLMGGDFLALASSAEEGDLYGFEYVSKIGYFSKNEGQDSNLYISYAHLDNGPGYEDGKGIMALGGDFQFKMNDIATQLFEVEYSKLRGNEDLPSNGTEHVFPIIKDEATYVYSKTDIRSPKYGKFTFSAGGINTGVHYDLGGLGNEEKRPFRETDVIMMEGNKYGGMLNLEYEKWGWEVDVTHATYGSNNSYDLAREKFSAELAYNLVPSRARVSVEYATDRPEIMLDEYNSENNSNVTSLEKVEGIEYIMPKVRFTNILTSSSENELRFYGINNKDVDKQAWKVYADHTQFYPNNISFKLVSTYEENYDYDSQDLSAGYDKFRLFELGTNFEKDFWVVSEGKVENTVLIGGRYSDKNYVERLSSLKPLSERSYRVFAFVETEYGPFTFKYGAKYQEELNGESGDLDKITGEKFKYGASVEYEFNRDFRASLSYGPVDIYETNAQDELLYDRTSAFDGEQDQASLRLTGRF